MAGYQNLYLNQSETFTTSLSLSDVNGSPYNLTGFTVKSSAKRSYYASNTVIDFTTSVTDANNGTIQLSASASETANIPATQLVYDVIVTQTLTGTVSRVLEGQIYVSPGVTKP